MYWLFTLGFILQVAAVGWYFYQVLTPNSEAVLFIHSDIRIFSDSNITASIPVISKDSTISVKVGHQRLGGSVIFYQSYNDVSTRAGLILFLNIGNYLIWLLFTWQLLKIFKSLKQKQIFEKQNIWRLQIVAIVVGVSPILELVRNIVYPALVAENAILPNHRISFYYDLSMFEGLFYMVLILLLVEIFKYSIALKEEQDLTI